MLEKGFNPDLDSELMELKVLVPRELAEAGLGELPPEPYVVRHRAEATLLVTAIRIATTPPDPAEHLYDLQQEEEARLARAAERRRYRQDALDFDQPTLDRLYPPQRLCQLWLANEREGRPSPPLEPWELRPLLLIKAHAAELEAKRRRGIEAARGMLGS